MPQTPGLPDHAARPEPVVTLVRLGALTSAAVVAVGGLVALIAAGRWGDLNTLGATVGGVVVAVGSLVAYVAPMWQAWKARAKVTPLSAPRNDDGQPLMAVPGLSNGPA